MSLESWKREFYRIPASQVSKGWALRHSLKKWIGLRPMNRKKHNVSLSVERIQLVNTSDIGRSRDGDDVDCLKIGAESCALCEHFDNKKRCENCPLIQAGIVNCKFYDSPYDKFMEDGSVVPMIKALQKAQKWMRREK